MHLDIGRVNGSTQNILKLDLDNVRQSDSGSETDKTVNFASARSRREDDRDSQLSARDRDAEVDNRSNESRLSASPELRKKSMGIFGASALKFATAIKKKEDEVPKEQQLSSGDIF